MRGCGANHWPFARREQPGARRLLAHVFADVTETRRQAGARVRVLRRPSPQRRLGQVRQGHGPARVVVQSMCV